MISNVQKQTVLVLAILVGCGGYVGCSTNTDSTANVLQTTDISNDQASSLAQEPAANENRIESECCQATAKTAAGCCCDGPAEASTQVNTDAPDTNACESCPDCSGGAASKCKCETGPQEKQSVDSTGSRKETPVLTHAEDRAIFHTLLRKHGQLKRNVKDLPNGVETTTESNDPELALLIQQHVASMYKRIEDGRRIRMWDAMYREIFQHADQIEMQLENTPRGIKVIETATDPYVIQLIQAHARVVSGFVKSGFEEAQKNHEPPKRKP